MTERTTELEALVASVQENDVVEDAWLAKSFTDRLLIVDVEREASFPPALEDELAAHDVYGYNEVYDTRESNPSFAGDGADATRHQFVDVRTRGDHRSYVVE